MLEMTSKTALKDDGSLSALYRLLPSIHELLLTPACAALATAHSRDMLVAAARTTLDDIRQDDGQETSVQRR